MKMKAGGIVRATHQLYSKETGKITTLKWDESSGQIQFQDGSWSIGAYSKEDLTNKVYGFILKPIRPLQLENK